MIFGTYDMPRYALKNREKVETSTLAGCYHCTEIYDPKEVKDYTDEGETCICPKCGVDAVVGNMGMPGEITPEKMKKAQWYWFNTKGKSSQP